MTATVWRNGNRWLCLSLACLLLAACAGVTSGQPAGVASLPETPQPVATDTAVPATAEPLAEPSTPETAPEEIQPIEVTYFTPAQGEGPYYTVDKPADRDNDLLTVAGATGAPEGQALEFSGRLYDGAGMPVAGAVIEIWQTDNNGVYLHPRDPGTETRDRNFQFYGEAVTAADGSYSFRTLLPGHYEPRPRHIHVKVKRDGQVLLTTQFYFDNDPQLATDPLFAGANADGRSLIMAVEEGQDEAGNPILIGERDVILRQVFAAP